MSFVKIKDIIEENRIAYEHGNRFALYPIFEFYRLRGGEFPKWVIDGAANELREWLQVPKKISISGPKADDRKMLQTNRKHYRRWLKIKQLRKMGYKGESLYDLAKQELGTEGDSIDIETIKTSYKKVDKAVPDPNEAWKYVPLLSIDPELYKALFSSEKGDDPDEDFHLELLTD